MNIKLTKAQVQALHQELSEVLECEHTDMTDKLLVLLLTKLFKKLSIKLLDIRRTYQLKLDDDIALALFIYYQYSEFNPTIQTDITLKKITDAIEKKFA
jgi:hypothetical protein